MTNGIIREEQTYKNALEELKELIVREPINGSADRATIEVLTLQIQDYERRTFSVDLPDPIDAIKFRMEQQGLQPRDLIPFIGSRSKVSEILNRKRSLTIPMIRALQTGLGIPAKVLIRETDNTKKEASEINWSAFPVKEMVRRGWISANSQEIRIHPEDVVKRFFKELNMSFSSAILYRKTESVRAARSMDAYALTVWTTRVQIRAFKEGHSRPYHGEVNKEFLRQLIRVSSSPDGPRMAVNMLQAIGVAVIIEPHLPGTFLDGATLMMDEEFPVIGMTIRHDRVDNFWFTLIHELAHLFLHLGGQYDSFVDDLDFEDKLDSCEREADDLASEILIPSQEWTKSPASKLNSEDAALHLARKLGIHPAIIAGRMRHELKNYRILSQLVGYGEVRKLFPKVAWDLKDVEQH